MWTSSSQWLTNGVRTLEVDLMSGSSPEACSRTPRSSAWWRPDTPTGRPTRASGPGDEGSAPTWCSGSHSQESSPHLPGKHRSRLKNLVNITWKWTYIDLWSSAVLHWCCWSARRIRVTIKLRTQEFLAFILIRTLRDTNLNKWIVE